VDADILLFDEVLAVGDARFQEKCFDTFRRLQAEGHTIVYVSHNLATVKEFADRVMLLDHGEAVCTGAPEPVIAEYERRNRERDAQAGPSPPLAPGRDGAGLVELPHLERAAEVEAGAPPPEAPKLRRFAHITSALAVADFRLRYLDSALGYLWSLMHPLLLFGVLYVVFTEVIRFGAGVEDYPLKLLLAIVLFTYFTEASGLGLGSLVGRGELLRKLAFPPAAVPLSSALASAFTFTINLCAVVLFVLVSGIGPTPAWLELIPLVALLMLFTVGVSMLLALLYVPFRDMKPIWEVCARLLFFATPVFYPIELVSEGLQKVLMINPLGVVVVEARHALIDPSSPSAAAAAGGAVWLAIPLGITLALLTLALWLYRRTAAKLAERGSR